MLASEAQLIAGSILADVLRVCLGQALDGGIDGFHAALLPHAGSGEVGVSASTCARTHTPCQKISCHFELVIYTGR